MDYAMLTAVSGAQPDLISQLGSLLSYTLVMGLVVIAFMYFFEWGERKIVARSQSRHGSAVGRFGLLQGAADMMKLMAKENIEPHSADKFIFVVLLPMMFSLFCIMIAFIPLSSTFVGINANYGLIAVFISITFIPLLMFLLGWASGNKFSEISAQRTLMMLMSYEIPLLLVFIAVAMAARSYNISTIVDLQHSYWYILTMPIGGVVGFVAMLAALEIPPFDIEQSEGELISGSFTDLGAHYYMMARTTGYMRAFMGILLMVLLFFGGWHGFANAPLLSLLIKIALVSIVLMVTRVISVRMQIDGIIRLGWIYLVPLAIVNLLITFFLFIR